VHQVTSSGKAELEETAVTLARLAGERIVGMSRDSLSVQFKSASGGANSSPVCDVDREVEAALRAVLAERFAEHAVVGEEGTEPALEGAEFVWVIDPLDGTTNYLNGVPLYAASVGVLWRGVPVAGAIWCAASHALRPGIYHGNDEGPLRFEAEVVARRPRGEWRGLASEPGRTPQFAGMLETRVLASAALECAFAAAGLVQLAFLPNPQIWDVAAGLVLARAAKCRALTRTDGCWVDFDAFPIAEGTGCLREWRQPLLVGRADAIERALETAQLG
jgi:myo-inositol-1(or 4)-monophosphatase